MKEHQSTPIHCALTELPKPYEKVATKMFKCILGFCGDQSSTYPEKCASEAVGLPLADPALRVEFYCQLFKQLTGNDDKDNKKAWELCAVALASFPPPLEFENHVAFFLKKNAPRKYRQGLTAALYCAVYDEDRRETKEAIRPTDISNTAAQVLSSKMIHARYFDQDVVDVSIARPHKTPPGPPPPPLHKVTRHKIQP